MNTPIIEIVGVGAKTADTLSEYGYHYAEELAIATEEDLLKITGFGPSRAKKVIEMHLKEELEAKKKEEIEAKMQKAVTRKKNQKQEEEKSKEEVGFEEEEML